MPDNNPYPVYDRDMKKWTAEGPGGLRLPDLWFESEADAQKWCDTQIKNWER
jgi:hypothetical protein